MRLKCIKLAGFKSFVDATTVNFPTNMCGVVGPNGCGKSNIIDAVRWVMGESSAKNLRGESMTDVIFNGSKHRKPVGYASVELVFDNSDGSIIGEYAAYNEISVKRKLTSESKNFYFLNGAKCRRRDIMDIFLGTGLGPRSYAIISQGIVSNLIESKPEELRIFIEEAAGISKYKERRRETENRIRRTRENMERLTDLREELERQLQHLHRQAQAAEKYKKLREEERLKKAQLMGLKWRDVNRSASSREADIRKLELEMEEQVTKQRAFDADIEKARVEQHLRTDQCNEVQSRFYSLGNEVTKIEQTIAHRQERSVQLKQDLQDVDKSWHENSATLEEDTLKLQQLDEELLGIEPELELIKAGEEEAAEALMVAEEAMQQWQQEWDQFNQRATEPKRRAEVEQSKIQHTEQVLERLGVRQRRLQEEREQMGGDDEALELELLREQQAELELSYEELQMRVEQTVSQIELQREQLSHYQSELDQLRHQFSSQSGRHASLEALQQAALGQSDGVVNWLKQQGLEIQPRVAEQIKVEPGWEKAVETVLGESLQAVCVDGMDAVASCLGTLTEGKLHLFDRGLTVSQSDVSPTKLLSRLESPLDLNSQLGSIYIAETLAQALELRGQLQPHESVVTADGIWLSRQWLRVSRDEDEQAGMLARQQELEHLSAELDELQQCIARLEDKHSQGHLQLKQYESEREQGQRELAGLGRQQSELRAEISAHQARNEQLQLRRQQLDAELQEIAEQLALEQEHMAESRLQLQEALDLMEQDSGKREQLLERRDETRLALDQNRQKARHHRDTAHQMALRQQTLSTQRGSIQQGLQRLQQQAEKLGERRKVLEDQLNESTEPAAELQLELEALLEQRLTVEEELTQARQQLQAAEALLRESEKKRSECESKAEKARTKLERERLDWQGMQVLRQTLQEQLQEAQYDLDMVLENLPAEAEEKAWEQDLEKIALRIQRLGAINLAAIEEYETQSQRKKYLDRQNDDLISALDTLEGAIRRIDKETRARFKETFDRVNSGLQQLFPKVFGGGQAYLELTGEDLLETGVAIMAQPPGKKNSTIHLLSGGEKALTAIALVFSIFQLNPAPFCLLDEVDAPLDDANVGRYARLVLEMSERVQFIYITHNKIAMEAANQLIGVTMHEPGVSRPVSVDVEEAAKLAEA